MQLILNGKPRDVDGVFTLEDLIGALGIHRMIVVMHNGGIVDRDRYPDTRLSDGDVLEIAHFVGGG
jgi:sulfur carrier protein